MGWATHYIEKLQRGETVQFRPRGNSMVPLIASGDLCTVEPAEAMVITVGNIVLCRVRGYDYLHLVKAMCGERFLIGNNRGRDNGWVAKRNVYGVLTKVEA